MTDLAIRVTGLGKEYALGKRERYGSLRDSLVRSVTAPLRWITGNGNGGKRDTIWALRDVDFEIKRGEIVGVIGRNGAGKSTCRGRQWSWLECDGAESRERSAFMSRLTVEIPQDLRALMSRFPDVSWTEVARSAIAEKAGILARMQAVTSRSRLTERDAVQLGREIKRRAFGKRR